MAEQNKNENKNPVQNQRISKKFNDFINKSKELEIFLNKNNEESKNDSSSEDESDVITMFNTTPFYIKNGQMRDYQLRGLNWMISLYQNNINGILADEMGLGKTLQTISMIGYLKHFRKSSSPYLVVAPKSTLANWKAEFNKWVPSLKTVSLIGSKEERNAIIKEIIKPKKWDVCITSFEVAIIEAATFKNIFWKFVVIDEAHRIKNEKSRLAEIMRQINSQNRLLLTGTPLQNNLHELWALLNYLMPTFFDSSEDFDSWFDSDEFIENEQLVKRLHSILKPLMLRRLKAEVEKKLLPKKETKVYIAMTKMQREWYQKTLLKEIDIVNGSGHTSKMKLQNILVQLRKVCNHPYLFDGAEPGPPYTTDTHIVYNSAKMIVLDKLLPKLMNQESRVLIFCQMTRLMTILEDYFVWRGYKYCKLDGGTSYEARQIAIEDFNRPNSDKFIFMLSTRAGGLGINLVTADVVVLYDSDWNPQVDLQAMDRAHRIGQQKQVRVYRLIIENSVEERITEKADRKLLLDNIVIQQGRTNDQVSKKLGSEEMLSMIRHGANHVFTSKDNEVTDESIDVVLERGEKKTAELQEKLASMNENNLRSMTFDSTESIYKFEGEDYRDKHKQDGFMPWLMSSRRERKMLNDLEGSANEFKVLKVEKMPKPPKQPVIHDYQFYPPSLFDLLDKEIYAHRKLVGYIVPVEENGDSVEIEKEQQKIDQATEFTEDDVKKKEELLNDGFSDWSKKDFVNFIKANEKYGRKDLENISKSVDGKSPEEVLKYAGVFWKRYNEIQGIDRFMAQIEKGENKLNQQKCRNNALNIKMSAYKDPFNELKINYGTKKSSDFELDDDKFLLCLLYEIGLEKENLYDIIRNKIRDSSHMRFNFFLKSRTAVELQKRCQKLLSIIEKEIQESAESKNMADGKKEAKKRKALVPLEYEKNKIPKLCSENDLTKSIA